MINTKYVILNHPPDQDVLNKATTELPYIRCSVDGTKCIVKYEGTHPDFTSEDEYTHQEILEVLKTDEWKVADEFPA